MAKVLYKGAKAESYVQEQDIELGGNLHALRPGALVLEKRDVESLQRMVAQDPDKVNEWLAQLSVRMYDSWER